MQPQYPPQQQPQYPPTAPQQPYAPPAPQGFPQPPAPQPQYTAPPPQTYAYPPAPQYAPPPPQGYGQPPMPPPVAGTLDDFYAQPSTAAGKSLSFEAVGTTYTGIVTRPIGNSDIEQQTNPQNGAPAFFKDGRPKYVMRVPLQMQPSAAYPDGLAQWYCRGSARDDLVRAMAEAGAPEGPPEAGSIITITMIGSRPSGPGLNPTKLFQVSYRRPQNATDGSAPAAPPAAPPQPAPPPPTGVQTTYQPAPPPVYATNGGNTTTAPEAARTNGGQPPQYVPPPAPIAAPPVAVAPPPPAAAPLSPEQQQLLATLTGQAGPQPTH